MLREDNLGTFGHMITHAHRLLQQDSELARRAGARFILVDEFQDVNFAQVKVLQKVAGEERNVFAVGDPDQAIYRFRGASSAAFVLFQRHFSGARLIKLEKNRRSLSPILHSAFALISKNPNVFDAGRGSTAYQRSVLVSAREEDAMRTSSELPRLPVEAVVLDTKDTESGEVIAKLRELRRKLRCRWSDCAVLYRTHCESRSAGCRNGPAKHPIHHREHGRDGYARGARPARLPGCCSLGRGWRQPVSTCSPAAVRY